MIFADQNFLMKMISAQTVLKGLHDAVNFSDLCRLCGNKKLPAVSVFDKTSRTSYQDIINFHFKSIQISNTDALPLKLCNDCAKFVVSWHHFHDECVRINEVLSRIVDKCQIESIQPEPNYVDGKHEIEIIEVGAENFSQNTEKSGDCNNTVKSSKLSENNYEHVSGHYVFVDTNAVTINKYSKAASAKPSTPKEEFSGDSGSSNGCGATKCNKCGSVFIKSKVESANNRGTCYSCYSKMTKNAVTARISPIFKNYLVTDENRQNYFLCDLCNFSCEAFPEVFAHHYKTEHPRANLYLSFVNEADDPLSKFVREKNGIRSYRCDCCQLSCISRNVFMEHYAEHDNRTLMTTGSLMIEFKGDKFYCSVCQKKFAGLETARKHLRQVHGEKKYKCSMCQKGFTYEHKARIHEKRHLKIKPFMCDICSGTFVDKTNLENHMRKNLCLKYTCVWCDKNFRNKILLQKHLSQCDQRNVDSTEDKTKICGKPTKQSNSFVDEAKWQYKCAKCEKKFKSKITLRSHIINEFNLMPYKCFICNQRFQTTISLKKHLDLCNKSIADCSDPSLIVNSGNLFGCKLCGRKFRKIGYLRQHFRLHSNTKPYVCQFCGKSYTFRSSFRSHMLTEMNLRGYFCSACGKRYNSSSHLTTHIKKHHRLREFKCDACDKEFAYERDLKEHKKTHSDTKSSFCDKCGGLFKTKRYLKVHLERCCISKKR